MQKILIVEDELDVQKLLENHLASTRYSVFTANRRGERSFHIFTTDNRLYTLRYYVVPKLVGIATAN